MSAVSPSRQLSMKQLTGPGARLFILLYYCTMAILAIWTIGDVASPWPTLAGLVLFAAACAAIAFDTGARLSLRVTLFVASIGVVNALLISWQLVHGGHSQWYFGAGTVMLFLVSLRGRIVLAWVGFVAMAAVIAVWGATTETGLVEAIALIGKQAPIVLVGTMFAIGLRRTGETIERLMDETSSRATAEAVAAATAQERAQRLATLDQVATPLLTKLVDGSTIGPQDRQDFAIAEAELRDGLRARSLSIPAVQEAVRDARRRGLAVVLLDDSAPGSVHPHDLERVAEAVVDALRATEDGRVTARLLPPGRSNVATIVVDGSRYEAYEVARAGRA